MQSHYNPTLDRCFMLVTFVSNPSGTALAFKVLTDPFEDRQFGSFRAEAFEVKEPRLGT